VVLATGLEATAATGPSTAPGDYAILGLDGVTLRTRARVESGDVGCNAGAGAITLMQASQVIGVVAASTVRLGVRARAGQLFCTTFVPLAATTAACELGVTAPLVPAASLPIVQVDPGSEDVRLPRLAVRDALPPGAYGVVRLGVRGRLTLAGGEYAFRSVALSKRAELVCLSACTLRVAERIVMDEDSRLGVDAPLDARAVRVEVKGGGPKPAFRAYPRTRVEGTVYAPNGDVVLGLSGRYTGAFVGRTVLVNPRARIVAASAL
jgi:hypothetical protein